MRKYPQIGRRYGRATIPGRVHPVQLYSCTAAVLGTSTAAHAAAAAARRLVDLLIDLLLLNLCSEMSIRLRGAKRIFGRRRVQTQTGTATRGPAVRV